MSAYESPTSPSSQFVSWNKIPRLKDRPPDPNKIDESVPKDTSINFESLVSLKSFDTMQKNIEEISCTAVSQFKASKEYFKRLGNLFKKTATNKFFSASNSDVGSSNSSVGHTNVALQISDENNCEIIENYNVSVPPPPPPNQKYSSEHSSISDNNSNDDNNNFSDKKLMCDLVDKSSASSSETEAGGGASSSAISQRPFLPWPKDDIDKGVNSIYEETGFPHHNKSNGNNHVEQQIIAATTTTTVQQSNGPSGVNYSITEKSGSSGYYGSNLYSTSSVDEHIYCEPIIEYIKQPINIKPSLDEVVVVHQKTVTTNDLDLIAPANIADKKSNESQGLDEKQCLESLRKSITNLENCLESNVDNNSQLISAKVTTTNSIKNSSSAKSLSSLQQNNASESVNNLQKIIDNIDSQIPRPIWPSDFDDSLMDINLESFEMQQKRLSGSDKNRNLINLDSPVLEQKLETAKETKRSPPHAENVINFHNTREVLEKIRVRLENYLDYSRDHPNAIAEADAKIANLEDNIQVLKKDLENYLQAMNERNESEIKQFCTGISNQKTYIQMRNAFEKTYGSSCSGSCKMRFENTYELMDGYEKMRPISSTSESSTGSYSASASESTSSSNLVKTSYSKGQDLDENFGTVYVKDGFTLRYNEKINPNTVPVDPSLRVQRVSSKLYYNHLQRKRSSTGSYMNSDQLRPGDSGDDERSTSVSDNCDKNNNHANVNKKNLKNNLQLSGALLMDNFGRKSLIDREKMLSEWHKNKPSIWEQYYGNNRLITDPQQTLIRKAKIGRHHTTTISYPSNRPECDFTLDLPRAEALHLQLKREKRLRHHCRIFVYFLSLIFFILTVMIVSLASTKGKRMFGSML